MKIACVGAGPAGLYFALLTKLRNPGWDITLLERAKPDSTYGWGVTFGGDLLEKFYSSDPESARKIDQAAFRWANQIVDVQGKQVQQARGDGYSIERQRLLDILVDRATGLGVRFEPGREVRTLSQVPEADLIVACDGANSRIRFEDGTFQTNVQLGANKYLWLGTDKVFGAFMYLFVPTDRGWIWAYAYGIDGESSTFIVECLPETWTGLGFATMSPRDSLLLLEEVFARHLDGHHLVGQLRDGPDVRWLNFRTVTNQRWYNGKIVLTGDAAHTTHYSIGWGTKLAIEDVIALTEDLQRQDKLEGALQAYERRRQAALLQPLSEARLSAEWFENISRYIDLKPQQFATLLHGRRSPLLPHISPALYSQLLRATERVAILRELRRRMGLKAKTIDGRHKLIQAGDSSAISIASSKVNDS